MYTLQLFYYLFADTAKNIAILIVALFLFYKAGFFNWIIKFIRKSSLKVRLIASLGIIAIMLFLYLTEPYPIHFAMPPTMHSMAPGGKAASIPFGSAIDFFMKGMHFERIKDIGRDPNAVPLPISRKQEAVVTFTLTAKEVLAEVSKGIYFNYWTYNEQVPGPMLRVREGDTVEIALTNDKTSLHPHNIDLHAVTGPGGGASVTTVMPGQTKAFRWKALNPGLYVYHCASPNVSTHNSHGQYGLILVEPKEGLPKVDKEFYLMQGELYTTGQIGKKGLQIFDSQKLLDGIPTYITFNGKIETTPRMTVKTGDKVRIFVGNGGVNLISSFHPIGEIFDTVYPEAAIGPGSALFKNVQTTAVLPGGAAIVEFKIEVPGKIVLVDHALARMNKGAWAIINAVGPERPDIFNSISASMDNMDSTQNN